MRIPTHFMNFSAALDPQGNLSGRSNVFPNRTSLAEQGCRNLPAPKRISVNYSCEGSESLMRAPTLHLYAPRNPFAIWTLKILGV